MIKEKLLRTTDDGLMKFTNTTAVAGNILAEMLEIEHPKMMRTIKRTMEEEQSRKSHLPRVDSENLAFNALFEEWEYTTSRGRVYKTYIINEDALYLVIANSQSAKAHELKVWFKSEFNLMRIEREVRRESIEIHKILASSIQQLYIGLKKEGSSLPNEGRLHTIFTKKINKSLFGEQISRDTLDEVDNKFLSHREEQISDMILACLDENMSARDTRKLVYKFIEVYGKEILGEELQWVA